MNKKNSQIYAILCNKFPEPRCELKFLDEYQLLVSVILSAQCTDKRVNQITKDLFHKYPTVYDMAKADVNELEQDVHSCGFFRNKAKNIKLACQDIVTKYEGKLPREFDRLTKLAGVGRKTANVVTSVAFNLPAFAVDTHVFRVSNRLGIVKAKTPEKAEEQLKMAFPKKNWSRLHHMFVLFGRYTCTARNPKCENCELRNLCDYFKTVV